MNGRIKLTEFYVTYRKNNTSNEDNEENFEETINDSEGWGEDGVAT
jgi:hypothetical protein